MLLSHDHEHVPDHTPRGPRAAPATAIVGSVLASAYTHSPLKYRAVSSRRATVTIAYQVYGFRAAAGCNKHSAK